jgi:TRAP-type mannitol/chloroaromatic compound transport system permease small subunit
MNPVLRNTRRAVTAGGYLSALVFLPALILTSIFDIVTRRFIQLGSTSLQELTWHFFFACVMFSIGYGYLKDRHVRVDILRERLPTGVKRRVEKLLLAAFLIPFCLVMIWFGSRMTWLSFLQGEHSRAALGLSARWIIKAALPLGVVLLLLAAGYRLFGAGDDGEPEAAGPSGNGDGA